MIVTFDSWLNDEPVSVTADVFVEYGIAYCDDIAIYDENGVDLVPSLDDEIVERFIEKAVEET